MNYYAKETNHIQSTKVPGLLEFPDKFMSEFHKAGKRAAGFVTVEDDGTTVTSCVWDEETYQAWCEENPEQDYLSENKITRIEQSKTDLDIYLATHPLLWADGNYYSITKEKQNQLTSKIMAATLAQSLSTDYDLTWNSTGEVCKSWTLQDLSALAFAIDKRVTALVSYQQTQEVAMREAATLEDLEAVEVDYDTVG